MDKSKKRVPHGKSEPNIWLGALIGGGIGLAAVLGLALIMPLALMGLDDPNGFALPAAAFCVFMGGLVGGFISANTSKGAEIISGLLSAAVIILPMLLISFIYGKGFAPIGFLIILASLLISSFLGAFAVLKLNSGRKRSMKRAMRRR